jgi:ATP-dependent Lon protease
MFRLLTDFKLDIEIPRRVPVVPLKDNTMAFPHITMPVFIGREKSINAIKHAIDTDKVILLTAQKHPSIDDPLPMEIYSMGTVAVILRTLPAKSDKCKIKALFLGLSRARILDFIRTEPFYEANIEEVSEPETDRSGILTLPSTVKEKLDIAVFRKGMKFDMDAMVLTENLTDDPVKLSYLIAANLDLSVEEAQEILEMEDAGQRLERISVILDREIDKRS